MPGRLRAFFLWVFLSSVLCSTCAAQVGNFCPIGPCNITNPVYVNVYWESSKEAWDQDAIKAGMPDLASARIDALTTALMHSNYFAGLSGYSVTSASFLRGVALGSCVPLPPELSFNATMMQNIAACIFAANPDITPGSAILNILIPPNVPPGATTAFCATAAGDHDMFGLGLVMTRIPAACNPNISFLFLALTHEMVEAATDPVPGALSGWKKFGGGPCGEIGDLCVSKCGATAPAPTFLFGTIQNYFVDGLKACFSPALLSVPPAATPSISVAGMSGGGSSTVFSLSGTSLAGVQEGGPWDLVNGKTLYLQASVAHPGQAPWSAGNIQGMPPDVVNFERVIWNDNGVKVRIRVEGFDSNYGSTVNESFSIEDQSLMGISRNTGGVQVVTNFPTTITAGTAITISGATPADLNGNFTVTAVLSPFVFAYKQNGTDETGGGGTVTTSPVTIVAPGDQVTFTYFDPQTGLSTTASGTIPFPDTITAVPADFGPGHPTVQQFASFSGTVTAQGSGVQGALLACASCTPAPTVQTVRGGEYILLDAPPGPVANTQTFTFATPGANNTPVTTSLNLPVFPVLTSVVPAIGPVAGSVSVTVNGAGFDPTAANDVINFNSPVPVLHGGHAQATPQSVNTNFGSAQLLTPPSPLTGDGSGYAMVTATVNQLESTSVEYLYVVPGKPWLELMPYLCGGGQATPNVYDANGNAAAVLVTLSASYPAFQGSVTGLTNSVHLTSGQSVTFLGFGPLTATNTQTSQSVTASVNAPQVSPCTAGNLLWPTLRGIVYLNPANLIPNVGPQCPACGNGLTHTGIWTLGNPATSIANVSIEGSSNREILRNFEVRAVGADQFSSYVNSSTLVAVQNGGIAALPRAGNARLQEIKFVGPTVEVGLRHHWCHKSRHRNEVFQVTFRLPKYATAGATSFHILRLVQVNGNPGWAETETTQVSGQGNGVMITTKELGIYALAQL